MEVIIENITESDVDEIIELGLATPELHVEENSPAYYPREALLSFIKSPHDIFLVAKVEGEIAGYRLATFNPYLREAYMLDLVVKPKFRKQGIAKKLYARTFEILRTKECFWVWALVKESNEGMQKVIEKQGFHQGSKFYFYYKLPPY